MNAELLGACEEAQGDTDLTVGFLLGFLFGRALLSGRRAIARPLSEQFIMLTSVIPNDALRDFTSRPWL